MKAEFDELVNLMNKYDLYQETDEVGIALNNLYAKIDEVMKRIECAVRSAKEFYVAISKSTITENEVVLRDANDVDVVLRSSNDVNIALDLNDTECIDNNWYKLFKPIEELKPIAVGNIEYDFPEEVYTIGNADNTEIVADVYESVFDSLCKLGLIRCEGENNFPFGKANYIVYHNFSIPIVKSNQIDLSKVPIKNEEFISFESSWGYISCDKDGNILNIDGEEEIDGERSYLYDIAKFDLVEYGKFCESKNIVMGEYGEDILAVGFWKKDGTYEKADKDFRKNVFEDSDDEDFNDAPTELCKTPQTHEFVKDIIAKLKVINVDGETMEYILEQVGMKEQVLKQLFAQTTNDDIDYLHDVRNGKG
jgi:hypothetical protein